VSTPPGSPGVFAALPGTAEEARTVGELFQRTFGREGLVLTGAAATKAALSSAAYGARFLHVATHGWFAGEGFASQMDAGGSERAPLRRAQATLTGFAPETLCGLALAGANRGRDAAGRVQGILTAEELATLDLSNCELAVLSACETSVGIR